MRLTLRLIAASMNLVETHLDEVISRLRSTAYAPKLKESLSHQKSALRSLREALDAMIDSGYGD